MEPGHQALGHERADLLFRKIDDGDDERARQLVDRIQVRDLRARFFYSEFLAEVDLEDVSGLARLGKTRAVRTRPTRSSTFSKSSQLIIIFLFRFDDCASLQDRRGIKVLGVHHLGNTQQG